jgi:hypothetical protein
MTDTNLVPCQLELDGRMQTVLAPPGYAVRHRKALAWREAERWRRQKRRAKASAAYRKGPTDRRRLALLEAIQDCTSLCNSEERAEIMFFAIVGEPAEIFWPTFLIDWPSCDRSWQWSRHILALLRVHRDAGNPATEFIEAEAPDGGIFHEDLPDLIEVWRGTDRTRVRNMSWTTDRKVAETFATGMRGGAFPDPVVAHAFIPKQWVFYASNDRSEAEVVLDPRRLRKLTIEPFVISKTARFAKNYVNRTIHEEAISNSG